MPVYVPGWPDRLLLQWGFLFGGFMIVRIEKNKNYTVISNYIFNEKDISAKAKGLFCYMMTLPDDWVFYRTEVYKHFPEGRTALDSAWNELEKHGYITQRKVKGDDGKFGGIEYTLHEKPVTDKPHTENPNTGNQQLLSTNKPNTNKPNTNNKIIKGKEEEQVESKEDHTKPMETSPSLPYTNLVLELYKKVNNHVYVKKRLDKLSRAEIDALRLLVEKDGVKIEDVKKVIDNWENDVFEFWWMNIQSAKKFRLHFNKLYALAEKIKPKGGKVRYANG